MVTEFKGETTQVRRPLPANDDPIWNKGHDVVRSLMEYLDWADDQLKAFEDGK